MNEYTTMHMALSVRGAIKWPKRELRRACSWIRRPDGSAYTPDELREALLDELADGNEFIPFGGCDNFDPESGCRGHRKESTNA